MNYSRKYVSWLLRRCGEKIAVRSKTLISSPYESKRTKLTKPIGKD
jgi:hypothetical protein